MNSFISFHSFASATLRWMHFSNSLYNLLFPHFLVSSNRLLCLLKIFLSWFFFSSCISIITYCHEAQRSKNCQTVNIYYGINEAMKSKSRFDHHHLVTKIINSHKRLIWYIVLPKPDGFLVNTLWIHFFFSQVWLCVMAKPNMKSSHQKLRIVTEMS